MICPSLKKCLCVSTLVILLALNLFTYNEDSFIFPLKFLNNFNKNISRTPPFKKWSINFSNKLTCTNLKNPCSQMQSHDLNSSSKKSVSENNIHSDSLFSVSCWIVPWIMFRKVGLSLHQLNNQIKWDLFFKSMSRQNMFCFVEFMFLAANILSRIHINSSRQSTNP